MSQVNFFKTADDENVFLDSLFSREDTHILRDRFFKSKNPTPVYTKDGIGKAAMVTLVNKDIMPKPRASSGGSVKFSKKFLFDMYRVPTIDFSRSRLSKGRLVNGRIYAKIGWLKPKEANKVYQTWYGSIERWLKKRYRRVNNVWWFGPDAWTWSMAGGVCCFGGEIALAVSLANAPKEWIEG